MKGGITRAKQHLMRKKGNIAPCLQCPSEIRKEFWNYANNLKDRKQYWYGYY